MSIIIDYGMVTMLFCVWFGFWFSIQAFCWVWKGFKSVGNGALAD